MRIIFYNNFHNGDLHYSRQFVKDIISKLNAKDVYYSHKNNKNVLKDIDMNYSNIPYDNKNQVSYDNDNILINTWIGQCGAKYLIGEKSKDCSLYSNYNMFNDIYNTLNIKIENIEFYTPTIDFSKLQTYNIDSFLNDHKKNVLICNGDVCSGQCPNFSFNTIINKLSSEFPNVNFILTNKYQSVGNNIFFTNDIININDCDLNEISYLSTFCDIIVGRASGPHAFTHIKDNYNNPNKTFISFTNKKTEGNWYDSDICNMIWSDNFNEINIYNTLKNELIKINE